MFCVKCGKPASIGNFCEDCYLKRETLFDIKDFKLIFCGCGAVMDGIWKKPQKLENIIETHIKTKNKITNKKISTRLYGNRCEAVITCSGFIKPAKKMKTEEKKIQIIVKTEKCDTCKKLLGNYFEAVLQLRGERSDDLIEKLRVFSEKIGNIESVKNGYDVKIIRKVDARKIVEFLRKEDVEVKNGNKKKNSWFNTENKNKTDGI